MSEICMATCKFETRGRVAKLGSGEESMSRLSVRCVGCAVRALMRGAEAAAVTGRGALPWQMRNRRIWH